MSSDPPGSSSLEIDRPEIGKSEDGRQESANRESASRERSKRERSRLGTKGLRAKRSANIQDAEWSLTQPISQLLGAAVAVMSLTIPLGSVLLDPLLSTPAIEPVKLRQPRSLADGS